MGEGGFGITYEGTNVRIGMRVAVKEFFCRDYMERDHAESDEVVLAVPEMEERFSQEKERFLKEARILGDFSAEPGIVHIIDYFELNGTAYIVMPFLDGQTLRQVVKEHGPMESEFLFRRMKPLMRSLEKVHDAGLVHRDISPDNIMLLSDDTLCLIDFGAAYRYDQKTKSYSIISKNGYAAPEQYRSEGNIGPAADVYSLSATLYYCLTGSDPVDSLQRILLDDLKMPDELGIQMPKTAQELIKKGLALRAQDRWQNIREMLVKIEEAFPEQTETPKKSKKKWIILGAAAAAVVLCVAAVLIWRTMQKPEYRFRNLETESIWLTPEEDLSVADYNRSAEIVRGRLEAFAGKDNYIWEEQEDGVIRMEFPAECLQGQDPDYLCKAYLTRPMNISLAAAETTVGKNISEWEDQAVDLTRDDIEKVELLTGEHKGVDRNEYRLPETGDYRFLRITLTPEAAERAEDLLTKDGCFHMYFDIHEEFTSTEHYYDYVFGNDDGRSFDLISWNQEGRYLETEQYTLTHPASAKAFYIVSQMVLETEESLPDIATGKNQIPQGALQGEVLQLCFQSSLDIETQKASWFHNLIAFKDRLDTLEIPYEFNLMNNEQLEGTSSFVVTVPRDSLKDFDLYLLSKDSLSFNFGPVWYPSEVYASDEDWGFDGAFFYVELEDNSDGEPGYTKNKCIELAEKMRNSGEDTVYGRMNYSYMVAECSLEELEEGIADNRITMRPRFLPETDPMPSPKEIGSLIRLMCDERLARGLTLRRIYLLDRTLTEKPDSLTELYFQKRLEPVFTQDTALEEKMTAFLQEYRGKATFSCDDMEGYDISCWLFEQNPETLAEDTLAVAEKLAVRFEEEFASGRIARISIYSSLNAEEDEDQERLIATFRRSSEEYRFILSPTLGFYNLDNRSSYPEEYIRGLGEKANEYLQGSTVLQGIIVKDKENGSYSWFTLNS